MLLKVYKKKYMGNKIKYFDVVGCKQIQRDPDISG